MFVRKKNGSILIEVMIFLAVLSGLIGLYYKTMITTVSKLNMYQIKEDIRTLDNLEIETINELITAVKNNESLYENVTKYVENTDINYIYKINNQSEVYIKIENGSMFLIKNYDYDNKVFRLLKVKNIDENLKKVDIYPTYYQIISRSENENGFNF